MKVQPKLKLLIITEKGKDSMIRVPTDRTPTHPGEMLLEEFLIPMELTQRQLAHAIHVPYQRINEIVNRRRGITPSTALRLEKAFGMSAGFWLKLQYRWDLYHAQQAEEKDLQTIKPIIAPDLAASDLHGSLA